MHRISLLLLFACGFAGAAENGAPAAEVAKPPVFETVTIANKFAQAVISAQRGSLISLSLFDSHPIQLPKPLLKNAGLGNSVDKDAPLSVLAPFVSMDPVSAANRHNWINSNSYGLTKESADQPWTISQRAADQAALTFDNKSGQIYELTYAMAKDAPSVRATLVVRNVSGQDLVFEPRLVPLNGIHQDYPPGEQGYYLVSLSHQGGENGKLDYENFPTPSPDQQPMTIAQGPGFDYVGLKSRFFAALFTPGKINIGGHQPDAPAQQSASPEPGEPAAAAPARATAQGWHAEVSPVTGHNAAMQALIQITFDRVTVKPGEDFTQDWKLTVSSMKRDTLDLLTDTEKRVEYTDGYYKFFKILVKIMTVILDLIVKVVQSYGVALIILTFLIKALLHRTTFKQQESMMKMAKLAPQMKLLQETYKNDRQKLATEQMGLFKKHGVHPLGGCLPILIQIPIFIALYQTFNHSADMRGHGFLWINDLTLPDVVLGSPFSFLSWLTVNPLPLIYIGVSVWMSMSQKMPANADPQQEQMMKMMRWMPVIFGFIFYNMPSGLVLYFTANAIISTIEIKLVKKKLGI
jgi:YidC/Oxa1 family membrane protein insertase